ncbi:hypothetical protein LL033_17810 [Clostridium estertheticum]|uniref:hypothetical protein n=1 Tax=Clostridium estertheticum TaxID=238834 RepID=UPI001C0D3E44|nr:hypothetical protein [Clostridium estertheticum]MBU3216525.1 hypothetical protein [Clostridium estertheticum]WAG54469.1 hypothetical protein LL033_17810 [Clostridium estertheticum]
MNQYEIIAKKIQEADAILIGAGNGFSICEGFNIFAGNQTFHDLFPDFIKKYGFCNVLDGGFFQYPTEEEKWTYSSRLIWNYSGNYHGKNLVVLELGIGWRNQMIKAPLMNLVKQEPNATYITVNKGEIYITEDIADKSFGLDGDMTEILALLKEKNGTIKC